MASDDILIVGTYDEARLLGARQSHGVLRMPASSNWPRARVVSARCHPASLDGLRIYGEVWRTAGAEEAPMFNKILATLARCQAKTHGGA